MAEINDRCLSMDDLGIGKSTVYKWIDKHGMPAHRMGRLWKFKKEQVMHGWKLAARLLISPMKKKINNSERWKIGYER